jgi:hypothetical protein
MPHGLPHQFAPTERFAEQRTHGDSLAAGAAFMLIHQLTGSGALLDVIGMASNRLNPLSELIPPICRRNQGTFHAGESQDAY